VSEDSIGRKFQLLNKAMQDFFLEWLPNENKIFEKKYIDPLDLNYLKKFQQGIEMQHSTKDLLETIKSNVKMLEHVAAEVFRLVSHEIKNTPLDMKVNPYTITLNGTVDSTSENALERNEAIAMDVEKMWFYKKEMA
ncbi:MAG: hypothetical protein JNL69_01245, partial [Bacteroidia bacterium]|nr:hypothetical protein [Bacteroidia bacterium]